MRNVVVLVLEIVTYFVDGVPREASEHIKSKAAFDVTEKTRTHQKFRNIILTLLMSLLVLKLSPQRNPLPVVNHPVGVRIPVGEEEVDGDVGEEDELHALEVQEMLGEATEEAEGEGGVEDGVDGPQEHQVRPHPVASAAEQSNTDHQELWLFSFMPQWHCVVYTSNWLIILMQSFSNWLNVHKPTQRGSILPSIRVYDRASAIAIHWEPQGTAAAASPLELQGEPAPNRAMQCVIYLIQLILCNNLPLHSFSSLSSSRSISNLQDCAVQCRHRTLHTDVAPVYMLLPFWLHKGQLGNKNGTSTRSEVGGGWGLCPTPISPPHRLYHHL